MNYLDIIKKIERGLEEKVVSRCSTAGSNIGGKSLPRMAFSHNAPQPLPVVPGERLGVGTSIGVQRGRLSLFMIVRRMVREKVASRDA